MVREAHNAGRMPNGQKELDYLFCPRSVAVIGSLTGSFFGGNTLIKQLLALGFRGRIYPINPFYDSDNLDGLKVFRNIREAPEDVDLAVIMTARAMVPQLIAECGEKGVKASVIVSDGFRERDAEGAKLQEAVVAIAKRKNIRLVGPNTIGIVNTAAGLMTMPYLMDSINIRAGALALCGQTGTIGPQSPSLQAVRYGVSKICDFGNKADVDEIDMLEYLNDDPDTKVIAMHLEDIKDGRRFLVKAKEAVVNKPVLVLKPGRTAEAARAAASHTGSLAGKDEVYDSAFRQAGIIRVDSFIELLNFGKMLAYQPVPRSNGLAIVTATGGAGVMGVDVAIGGGLQMARFSERTRLRLAPLFPGLENNPVDIGPAMAAGVVTADFHEEVIRSILEDEGVGCAVFVLPRLAVGLDRFIGIFRDIKEKLAKPVALWSFALDLPHANQRAEQLEDADIPVYTEVEDAVKALAAAFRYAQIRRLMMEFAD